MSTSIYARNRAKRNGAVPVNLILDPWTLIEWQRLRVTLRTLGRYPSASTLLLSLTSAELERLGPQLSKEQRAGIVQAMREWERRREDRAARRLARIAAKTPRPS